LRSFLVCLQMGIEALCCFWQQIINSMLVYLQMGKEALLCFWLQLLSSFLVFLHTFNEDLSWIGQQTVLYFLVCKSMLQDYMYSLVPQPVLSFLVDLSASQDLWHSWWWAYATYYDILLPFTFLMGLWFLSSRKTFFSCYTLWWFVINTGAARNEITRGGITAYSMSSICTLKSSVWDEGGFPLSTLAQTSSHQKQRCSELLANCSAADVVVFPCLSEDWEGGFVLSQSSHFSLGKVLQSPSWDRQTMDTYFSCELLIQCYQKSCSCFSNPVSIETLCRENCTQVPRIHLNKFCYGSKIWSNLESFALFRIVKSDVKKKSFVPFLISLVNRFQCPLMSKLKWLVCVPMPSTSCATHLLTITRPQCGKSYSIMARSLHEHLPDIIADPSSYYRHHWIFRIGTFRQFSKWCCSWTQWSIPNRFPKSSCTWHNGVCKVRTDASQKH